MAHILITYLKRTSATLCQRSSHSGQYLLFQGIVLYFLYIHFVVFVQNVDFRSLPKAHFLDCAVYV